jgi:hypothetical protein
MTQLFRETPRTIVIFPEAESKLPQRRRIFNFFPCLLRFSTGNVVLICLCLLTFYSSFNSPLFQSCCVLVRLISFLDSGVMNFVLLAF